MCRRRRREMEFASVAPSFSSTRSSSVVDDNPPLSLSRRHLSSATRDRIRVCRALSLSISSSNCVGDEKWISRLSRSLSLSLSLSLPLSRRGASCVVGDETWNLRLSFSQSRRHVSSATRQGIRVSRALSLSLSRRLETVGSALVLSSTDGDETRNPHLSLSPRHVSSGTRHGIRVFAACEVLTLRFLPCCIPVA